MPWRNLAGIASGDVMKASKSRTVLACLEAVQMPAENVVVI